MMNESCRWVLMEHRGALDDPLGIHFDLLLEYGSACRTWRLNAIPFLDGPAVHARLMPEHRLVWLDKEACVLSKGRGSVQPVKKGFFEGQLPKNEHESVHISISGNGLSGILHIENNLCRLNSFESFANSDL